MEVLQGVRQLVQDGTFELEIALRISREVKWEMGVVENVNRGGETAAVRSVIQVTV